MLGIIDRAPKVPHLHLLARRVAVVGGLLLSVAALQPAAAGAALPAGVEAALPANAAANPAAFLASVSCASPGNCSAVGTYFDSAGNIQGLLMTETGGVWGTGVEAALPAGAQSQPDTALSSVSCTAPGDCTAVGYYLQGTLGFEGLLLTETGGVWATGVQAPLPGAGEDVNVRRVSCASAGNCVAVGGYADASGGNHGLVLTETAGVWAALEAPLPANANATVDAELYAVSCPSVGNCTAVGNYVDSASVFQGLMLTETGGVWATGVELTLPANANANAILGFVSCASPGNCTATGNYRDTANALRGVLVTQSGGTWATGVEATPPANSSAVPAAAGGSVSCASAGECTAVGSYYDTALNFQDMMLTQTAGVWAPAVETALPADAATPPLPVLDQVSCASAGNCTAVGAYDTSPTTNVPLVVIQTGSTWATGVSVTLPANANASPQAGFASVSCPTATGCTAVGYYVDSTGAVQGLLLTEPTAPPPPPPPDFSDLIADSVGVGPGMSLVDKARTAQAQAQAGTTAMACTTLSGYVKLVKAQTPKTISRTIAADVTGDAASIATQLGC